MSAADSTTEAVETPASDDRTLDEEAQEILAAVEGDQTRARDQLLDEVKAIVDYLRPVEQKNKRRIRLYLLLRVLDVPVKDIADYIGASEASVRQALLKARRGRDGT